MVVTMPPQYDDPETKKRTLFQLAALMRNNGVTPHVQVIHRARVPVISFETVPDLGKQHSIHYHVPAGSVRARRIYALYLLHAPR